MGIWKSLFGKKPPRASSPPPADDDPGPAELLSGLDDDGAPVENVSVKSSPKEVCRYIFRQLAAGDRPPTLRSDLQKRGLSAKVTDMYVELVRTTMFKSR